MFYKFLFPFIIYTSCVRCLDKICEDQKEVIGNAFKKQNPISNYQFLNDSKTSLEVTWLGENSGKIILVTTSELMFGQIMESSDIYLSENNGKTFTKITEKMPLKKITVRKDNGLQRSTVDTNIVFLVCYDDHEKSTLVITRDGGVTWKKARLDFTLNQLIVYHPTNSMWLLTQNTNNSLFKSLDGGFTWTKILDDVFQFQWSTLTKTSEVIFAKVGKSPKNKDFLKMLLERLFDKQKYFIFYKYDGNTWSVINKKIFGFLMREKFLYVSELIKGNRRRLIVSVDEGKIFNQVYLPTIMDHQFYSILDIEDNMVFIHVDNEDNNGDGTLFISDSDGRVFSQSLMNHFYPSQSILSDFYKVQSMRATYIASQLKADKSIQTLITFNRGAEWKKINKPTTELCHDKDKTDCYLQIANGYSILKHVESYLPLSSPTAVGLILAHGHLAESLKNSKADVYVSSDGGYNWIKALSGPHQYVIADHGGLLVALGEDNKIIKFSTDEGRCWHEHQFTTKDIKVTGLLSEPGNKAMTVAIWGYSSSNNQWIIHVVDLSQVLNRDCGDNDYEQWFAHSEMLHSSGKEYIGCLLGKKETFLRLKKDSLCKNGYSHQVKKIENVCLCTKDDFECEYGYYRNVNSKECVRNEYIAETLCVNGFREEILTQGYKKIPSDVCQGGFFPDKTKQKMLNSTCNVFDNLWKKETKKKNVSQNIIGKEMGQKSLKTVVVPSNKFIYIIIGIAGTFVILFLIFVIINRTRNIRRKQSNLKYRVLAGLDSRNSIINDDDAALLSNEIGYESTGQTRVNKGKMRNIGDDSDVDLIG